MRVETKVVEQIGDNAITQIKLINDNGIEADFLTLGATWQAFYVPQSDGSKKNLVLGFDKPSDYLTNTLCAGQSIGRVAGRIDGGRVVLDDTAIQLPQNEKDNCLHGGANGFHKKVWDYAIKENHDKVVLTMTYQARENVDGFPGDMAVEVSFCLDNANRLTMTYTGSRATKTTLFNPTNHVYFNLSHCQDLTTHRLILASHAYLETREDLVPTGQVLDVSETAYDFRQGKNLAQAIQETGGLDDTFLVTPSLDEPILQLIDEESGDAIKLYSDRSAVVIYTMGGIADDIYPARDNGYAAKEFEGIALEAQCPPDAINHEGFGDIVLKPEETKRYTIVFEYGK